MASNEDKSRRSVVALVASGDIRSLSPPRFKVQLTDTQLKWVDAQGRTRGHTLRVLVDAARTDSPTPAVTRAVLVTALTLLDERGSWMRGSPRELLADLLIGEAGALDLVVDVCERMGRPHRTVP